MANELDEINGVVNENGRDVNVIEKQIPVKVGVGSTIFEILLWVCGIIPGIIFLVKKTKASNYFDQLQQKIQHNASTIDNYLEERVNILKNTAKLVDKAVALDKETFAEIAKLRSGNTSDLNAEARSIEDVEKKINVQIEAYPELKAHEEIADAMQQNSILQKQITAAREIYNDSIAQWNSDIQVWPTNRIVAAKRGLTTRVPFSISKEVKQEARKEFF